MNVTDTATDSRLALVVGGAECVWDDCDAVEALCGEPWPGLIIAANSIGATWEDRLDHWATYHNRKWPQWLAERERRGLSMAGVTRWSGRIIGLDSRNRTVRTGWGGSSGFLAVRVALELGCSRIVLAGVPMSPVPHFSEDEQHREGEPWDAAERLRGPWKAAAPVLRQYARSVSGFTRALLDAPTRDWMRTAPARDHLDAADVGAEVVAAIDTLIKENDAPIQAVAAVRNIPATVDGGTVEATGVYIPVKAVIAEREQQCPTCGTMFLQKQLQRKGVPQSRRWRGSCPRCLALPPNTQGAA